MRPIIDGKIPTSDQMIEAYRIDNMIDGPDKEQAKAAWVKRHNFTGWPRKFFRGNPDARDRCERQGGIKSDTLNHPRRYLIDSLS